MKDFRQLTVWQRAHGLVLHIYHATKSFPADERFGMTSQLRRGSASIPANIAEGCGRTGDPELGRFLQIAAGSASEVEYHLLLAHDLGYLDAKLFEQLDRQIVEVKKMLASFQRTLRKQKKPRPEGE
jgi:four helix bundle protein